MKIKLTLKYDREIGGWNDRNSYIVLCSDGIQGYLPDKHGSTIVITAQTNDPKNKSWHKAWLANRYDVWHIYIPGEGEVKSHLLLNRDGLADLLNKLTSNCENMDIWFKIE